MRKLTKWALFRLRILFFLIPIILFYLGFGNKDSFYYLLSFASLIASLFVVLPNLFSQKVPFSVKRKDILPFEKKFMKEERIVAKDLSIKNYKGLIIFIIVAFVLCVLLFIYFIIFGFKHFSSENNLFVNYYVTFFKDINLVTPYVLILSISSIILIDVLFVNKKIKLNKLIFHPVPILFSTSLTILMLLISFNVALILAIFIGIIDIDSALIKINSDPKSFGLIWGKNAVIEKIKLLDIPPKIIALDQNAKKTILNLYLNDKKNVSKFYIEDIVKSIPNNIIPELQMPKETLIMFKNSLLITEINKDEIQALSPIVGKLFLKKYLNPKYIKDDPNINIMGRQEYLKYREDEINKQIAGIDALIEEVTGYLNSTYANINKAKTRISELNVLIPNSENKRDSNDSSCRALNYCSYYYCYNYTDYCNSQRVQWDTYINGLKKELAEWNQYLPSQQSIAVGYENNKNDLENYKSLMASQKDQTPQELGLFEPENQIKVVLDTINNQSLADFFDTVVHEYLHYTSFVSKDSSLPPFFEEGLTEYYSRKIIKDQLNTSTNMGYPVIVKIIEEMAKKIPNSELEDIYFTKNLKELISVLNNIYGKNFYKDSEFYFSVISYLPSTDALKVANNILFKIGGNELREEDLYSKNSQLQ